MNVQQWLVLPETRKDAWWLWTGLQSEIKQQCEMLIDSEYFESSLPPLAKDAVLSYAQPWYERIMVALRCDSGDYLMNVLFDPDLLAVRYVIDRDPFAHDLLIVRRRKQSLLLGCDGSLLSSNEAAKRIVMTLTYRS